MDSKIVNEKLNQAVALLKEQGLDLWLVFARETTLTPDPCLDLIAGGLDFTWHSAFIVSKGGAKIAVVGRFDAGNVNALNAYTQVIPYDQSIRPALIDAIQKLNPGTIAVDFSQSDPSADGLSYGMWSYLQDTFANTRYATRFVSAEKFVASLRGRKSATETARVKAAIRTTEKLYRQVGGWLKPGRTEKEIAARMTAARKALGLEPAWDEAYCPIVNAGPNSVAGHGAPASYRVKRGQLVHLDFGVQQNGFSSDLQRMWYVLEKGEKHAPDDVMRVWEACWSAVLAGAEKLKPGVQGWEVDAAAREYLVKAGYPEYQHALGHHLGRVAHDGSTTLGPKWDRYGQTPYGVVEVDNIFTLELGAFVPRRGYIGLEEDVLVTKDGIEWLSTPQKRIWLV
jgi:Xaa-Pro aminopeptidase